jgi:hypothetical protein
VREEEDAMSNRWQEQKNRARDRLIALMALEKCGRTGEYRYPALTREMVGNHASIEDAALEALDQWEEAIVQSAGDLR